MRKIEAILEQRKPWDAPQTYIFLNGVRLDGIAWNPIDLLSDMQFCGVGSDSDIINEAMKILRVELDNVNSKISEKLTGEEVRYILELFTNDLRLVSARVRAME